MGFLLWERRRKEHPIVPTELCKSNYQNIAIIFNTALFPFFVEPVIIWSALCYYSQLNVFTFFAFSKHLASTCDKSRKVNFLFIAGRFFFFCGFGKQLRGTELYVGPSVGADSECCSLAASKRLQYRAAEEASKWDRSDCVLGPCVSIAIGSVDCVVS